LEIRVLFQKTKSTPDLIHFLKFIVSF